MHKADYIPTGIPVIMPTNIRDGRIVQDGIAYISEENANRLLKHRVRIGDIVFSRRGEVDKCAVITAREEGWLCGTGCLLARPNITRANPYFMGYSINTVASKTWLNQNAVGATMPNLNTGILKRLPVPLPELSLQDRVASVLSALDDKIELNRRMNETLEAQARALFRDWFVDFGPVKAKMANRITANTKQADTGDAGAAIQAPYLSDEIWSLFPSTLDDDGKPEGWSDYRVEELADYRKGSVNPANEPDVIFEHYSLPAYDTREEPALDFGATIKSNKTLVPEGAILLSKLNPETPRVWIPDRPTGRTQVASTEFLAFVPKQGVGTALVYSLFNETTFRQTLAGMVTGTSKSHQRILPGALIKMAALSGAPQLFGAFENLVAPMLSQILANRYQSRTLAQTRDLLLPKLMSGEIRVAQAAREIEAVF
ncbi:restriction endonuclease subunit S [Parasphingorhabdus sp.]|uniref:restriction endonuclease subunit S n=1 Tax=Parasphingorhabdus sp. TaxID=2709688 RepID=UPI002F93040B